MRAASGLLDAVKAAGADSDQLLQALKLDPSAFSNAEGVISCSLFARLLEEAARVTGDSCFGLHFGERFNVKNIGPLTYAILNSPTVSAADENVSRYLKLYNQAAKVSRVIEGDRAYLQYVLTGLEGIEVPRQENEYALAIRLNTIRMMVGSQWTPLEVQFAHPAPAEISEHLRVFGAPVLFGYATNNIVVDREFLMRQVPSADPRLYGIMKRYLEQILEEMPAEHGVLPAVRRAIAETMRECDPNLGRVAKKLAMSPRTLQRQLKKEGMEFKQLVDSTRRYFAESYLKDGKTTLTEIAFLLGYSEASAFARAFKRWTGSTPVAYRRQSTHAGMARHTINVDS